MSSSNLRNAEQPAPQRNGSQADLGDAHAAPNGEHLPGVPVPGHSKADIEIGPELDPPKDPALYPASSVSEPSTPPHPPPNQPVLEDGEEPETYAKVTYLDILKHWSLMGYIGFGGPAAHIGELDRQRAWPLARHGPTHPPSTAAHLTHTLPVAYYHLPLPNKALSKAVPSTRTSLATPLAPSPSSTTTPNLTHVRTPRCSSHTPTPTPQHAYPSSNPLLLPRLAPGLFQRYFVERLKWCSLEVFTELFALGQCLPGPTSTQVSFAIGTVKKGVLGGFLGGLSLGHRDTSLQA